MSETLHLSTPIGRLVAMSVGMALNLPLWPGLLFSAVLGVFMPEIVLLGALLAIGTSGVFAGWFAARYGRIGGNLEQTPDGVLLDFKPVLALVNHDIANGWMEVQFADGRQARMGTPTEIRRAVAVLEASPGPHVPVQDRVDGFEAMSEARGPALESAVVIPWATVCCVLGLVLPFVPVLLEAPSSVVGLVFAAACLAATFAPGVALGAFVAQGMARHPLTAVRVTGNVVELERGRRVDRVVVTDASEITRADHPAGVELCIGDVRVVCTRPFMDVVWPRLQQIPSISGDATAVPDALARMRGRGTTE